MDNEKIRYNQIQICEIIKIKNIKNMKTLLKSSNFWNAVIGGVFVIVGYMLTESELVVGLIGAFFSLRAGDKWHQNYMNAKGIGGGGLQKPQSYEADGGIGGGGLLKPKK